MNDYIDHVDRSRDEAVAWLNDAFTPKAELREQKKAAKKAAKKGDSHGQLAGIGDPE